MALLAAVVREDPGNAVAVQRLIAALSQRNFPRLIEVTNAPTQPGLSGTLPCRSPDGAREFRRLDDGTGRFYDSQTGQPQGALVRHATGINAAWFSPDGLRLVTTCNQDISARIWDATTGQALSPWIKYENYGRWAQFSPDGLLLVTGSCEGTARLCDGLTGDPQGEPMNIGNGRVTSIAFGADGQQVIATTVEPMEGGTTPRLCYVFDVLPGQCLAERSEPPSPVKGAGVFSWTTNASVRIWDVGTGRLIEPAALSNLAGFSRVWDAAPGQPRDDLRPSNIATVFGISLDGQRYVRLQRVGILDERTVRILDNTTFLPLSEPLTHDAQVRSAWLEADGRRLVVGLDGGIRWAWDLFCWSGPAPAWLPDLAEAVAGIKLNEKLVARIVPWPDRINIQKQLALISGIDDWTRWLKWFLADRGTRTISPFSTSTMPEYIQRRMQENTLASLREAVRFSPTNGLAYARLAKQVLRQSEQDHPRRLGEADFFSRRAAELAPQDAEVQRVRSEILAQVQKHPKP